jgi:AraC-like DNA-binding protein
MKWITREHPKIDRIACPWLIKRFVDEGAEIIYAPYNEVVERALALNAIPFDMPGVEYSHHEEQCTFDFIIQKHQLKDEALNRLALVVRGADTDRHDIAPQASGLWAVFAGLSYNIQDDYELLNLGMIIYDGLYSWAKHLYTVKHTQAPVEKLLVEVLQKYLQQQSADKKIPDWARELQEMIQDQIDTNLHLSLGQVSKELDMNPAYLSREFSKYFENLSFGEYIRKIRIEKAIQLIQNGDYSMTEIAYLAGFSDQSHFTRIFRKFTSQTPLTFKRNWQKSKKDTRS